MSTMYALAMFASSLAPLAPAAQFRPATVDECALNPGLFNISAMSPADAARIVHPIRLASPRLNAFVYGYYVSGECAKYLRRSYPAMIRLELSNGASFVEEGPPTYKLRRVEPAFGALPAFSPTPNIQTIAGATFGGNGSFRYVDSIELGDNQRFAIWSNARQSLVGTIICEDRQRTRNRCTVGHIFLTSSYRIRQIGFMPMMHASGTGDIMLWISMPSGVQAYVRYGYSGLSSN